MAPVLLFTPPGLQVFLHGFSTRAAGSCCYVWSLSHTLGRKVGAGFKFLLCKERPDLSQKQEKEISKSSACSVTTMVDPVILQALWRGLKHLWLRNLDVRLRKERLAGFGAGLEEQAA